MKELGIATELGKARLTGAVTYPGVDQVSKLFFNLSGLPPAKLGSYHHHVNLDSST